ncbi:hypothetical protein [Parvularcula maris]|uniref:Uncharacterized protein n=1 Tax=Parvularcula maris TaxID=2965077 RepID=A0A9X2RK57_9PROT|nr:hypothetical protein [Parvularcula maris]MCQ8185433.1 hypothetical protein [Parvularcula maris]
MKRNFQAIDAIAFAFGFGFKGFSILLRLGWPTILLYGIGIGIIAHAFGGAEAILAPYAVAMQELGVDVGAAVAGWIGTTSSAGSTVTYDEASPAETFALLAVSLGSSILMVPAYTALIRASAGREPRGGVLPLFGRAELYLIAGWILAYLLFVLVMLVLTGAAIGGFFGAAAALGGPESVPAAIIGGVLGFAAILTLIWFSVRLYLWPGIAAVTEDLSLKRGFGLSGGRFWKLLGSFILFALLIGVLSLVVQMVMLGLFATDLVIPALGLYGLLMLYMTSAQMGFYGRIIGDLLVDPENPGRYDDISLDTQDDDEFDLADTGEQHFAEAPVMMRRDRAPEEGPASAMFAAASGERAEPQGKRSSISFVRRRFRG